MEQEFYKAGMVGYYPMWPNPITSASGTLTVTDQKIHYKPMAMYFVYSPINLTYDDITKAEATSVLGLFSGNYIKIISKKGKQFVLCLPHSTDAQPIIDFINQHVNS